MANGVVVVSLDWVMGAEADLLAQIKSALAALKERAVAVVGATACDRAEVEPIRAELEWHDPFITESGSAIFTPVHHNPFSEPLGEQDGDYFIEELGCPYVQARAGLRVLANLMSHPLKGYGDFTVPQLEKFLEVPEDVAHRAKAREFSEPFMTPKAVAADALVQAAEEMGFQVVLRDPAKNRFSELVGAGASLAGAIAQLVDAYRQENSDAFAVAIGQEEELALFSAGAFSTKEHKGKWAEVEVRSPEEWLERLSSI